MASPPSGPRLRCMVFSLVPQKAARMANRRIDRAGSLGGGYPFAIARGIRREPLRGHV
jgi:hypothetical protein